MTTLRAGRFRSRGSIFGMGKILVSFPEPSRPAMGPIQPYLKKVPAVLTRGVKRPGRDADHSSLLVIRLRMSGTTPSLLHLPSRPVQRQPYLHMTGH